MNKVIQSKKIKMTLENHLISTQISQDEYYSNLNEYLLNSYRIFCDILEDYGEYCTVDYLEEILIQTNRSLERVYSDIIKLLFLGYVSIDNNDHISLGSIKFHSNPKIKTTETFEYLTISKTKFIEFLENNNYPYKIENERITIMSDFNWENNYLPDNLTVIGDLKLTSFLEKPKIIPKNLKIGGYIQFGKFTVNNNKTIKCEFDVWLKL